MLKSSVTLIVLFISLATGSIRADVSDKEAISQLVKDWEKSFIEHDAEAMGALYTETPIYFPRTGVSLSGKSPVIAALQLPPEILVEDIHIDIDDIDAGSEFGYVYGRVWLKTHMDGKEPDFSGGRFLLVVKRNNEGQWRIHLDFDQGTPEVTATNWPR